MSLDMMASERVCYVHCNFCNTILAVSVPCSSLFTIVTVRCGHCGNLLSVNMGGVSHQTVPPQDPQLQKQNPGSEDQGSECGSSSKCNKHASLESVEREPPARCKVEKD